MYGVRALDKPLANPELAPSADRYVVSPDFMRTLHIPILRGRGITDADDRDSAAMIVVVSAALAEKVWGKEDPIGKQVQVGEPTLPWRTVVGVAGNVRHHGLDEDRTQQLYIPERQWPRADDAVALVVRTHGDPARLAPAVRRVVQGVDPSQPIVRLESMQGVISDTTARRRLALLLFAAFALIAATLAAAGIYGVLSGMVAERTREIGVRSALGATPGDILQLVLSRGAALAATGLAVGLVGALALGRFLQGLLFAVSPADPLTLGTVAALLGVIALLACVVPARRAVRVDPMTALRAE
jgi:putative ABC transport system permease protein